MTDEFEYLREFCTTVRHHDILDALQKSDGKRNQAWRAGGIDGSHGRRTLKMLKERASQKTITHGDGSTESVDESYLIKGKSILYDEAGNVKIQWVKTDIEKQNQNELLHEYVESLCSFDPAEPKPMENNYKLDDELMSAIFIGDAHVGMKAWSQDTRGMDFDTNIAEGLLRGAVDNLVARAPNSDIGLLVDVGDFQHANDSHGATYSGTQVDVDTRQGKTLRTSADIMCYAIGRMLEKFSKVIVVVARGNHNPDAAQAVQLILEFYYKNEPRVEVLPTEGFFHYLQWGKWLIGVNHGDKIKPSKLVSVMARDMAKAWGECSHRMWALGHFHHQNTLELDGCIVQKFGALTPPDSWHAGQGYGSNSVMEMITFKKQGGKHSTLIYELDKIINEPDIIIE